MTQQPWSGSGGPPAPVEWLPALDIPAPEHQNRLTVFFRALLLIPHFIVLFVLSIVAFFATVAGWFAALVLGRLPDPIAEFLTHYLGYRVRVMASLMLLTGSYPPFALTPPDFPVRIEVRPGPLNRLAVFFRLILMIPAAIVQSLVSSGWWCLSFIWWLITLILGRMPGPLFEATAATLRYMTRFDAYTMMLTSAYPKKLFGDRAEAVGVPVHSATRPLLISSGGQALLVLFLVLGIIGAVTPSFTTSSDSWDWDAAASAAHR
ncbi:DUF4389 domain-containing protein [Streptomyces sp. NPDC087903]|uniref:DUF4389 domain-containing protein n=1 Tax=Streptomyces sp. NPDC087903 TaxID=3365819 RepID=UPI00381D2BCE